MKDSNYIPGMCNINRAEVAYRRKAMWFGVIFSILLAIALIVLHAPWWTGIVFLFLPVYIAAIGYLQVTNKFCVSYGASGKQNADDGSTEAELVSDKAAREADKRKTRKMNLQALGITIAVITLVSVLLYAL